MSRKAGILGSEAQTEIIRGCYGSPDLENVSYRATYGFVFGPWGRGNRPFASGLFRPSEIDADEARRWKEGIYGLMLLWGLEPDEVVGSFTHSSALHGSIV